MAATALDVVSLERIKAELTLDASHTDRDPALEAQVEAAVTFVARHTSAPLIDRTETLYVVPARGHHVLCLQATHVKSAGPVRYWSLAGALRDEPDGEIAETDLGRQTYQTSDRYYLVWPPAGGWPATLAGSLLEVDAKRGLDDTDPALPALQQAVVLCVRQLFNGYREIRPTEAFYDFIAPWRRYD
ncbi:hypothetical protein [Candidatus Palauibacter sp.]|uniref:hypothetical protein n=1 Tax=Candidatus Palauibacter sp. TaxID=3101350 RepID=UPI003CC54CDE